MYCSGCGQDLSGWQGFCSRCGVRSGLGMPYSPMQARPGMWLPTALVERRVNALAVGWLVYAGLVMLTGAAGLAFASAWMGGPIGGPWGWHHFGHPFGSAFGLGMPILFRFAGAALFVRVGLALAAGFGLLLKKPWGRWVAIVAGCLALVHVPFGLGLGIWTLVVLLNTTNAAGYAVMAGE